MKFLKSSRVLRFLARRFQGSPAMATKSNNKNNPNSRYPDLADPEQFYNLYESELGSDVTLLVGQEGCQERVPAHSWVLANGSDFFRALLNGPFLSAADNVHRFPDDPKGFNNLIRWLYQNKCDIQSLQSSLETLNVAIKYLCPDLAERCIFQLTKQLNVDNVVQVLRWIHCYCSIYQQPLPSAPCLDDLDITDNEGDKSTATKTAAPTSDNSNLDPTASCQILLNRCFQLIDQNTDQVLESEDFLSTEEVILSVILKRDTLKLSSELKVVKALTKWSTATCKRRHFPLTLDNRRAVLGPLLYLTRFLTMSVPEVEALNAKQADNSCLLKEEESVFVDAYVRRTALPPVPETMKESLSGMSYFRNSEGEGGYHKDMVLDQNRKRKTGLKGKLKFNKKEMILNLVSLLGLIFD